MSKQFRGWKIAIVILCIIVAVYITDTIIFIFNNQEGWQCQKDETFISQTLFIGNYGNCVPKLELYNHSENNQLGDETK